MLLTIEPGTTPEITVEMPVEADAVVTLFVTFTQGQGQEMKTVLEKSLQQLKYVDKLLKISLTQEETLKLPEQTLGEWQIRFRTISDQAMNTIIAPFTVGRVLKKGVI